MATPKNKSAVYGYYGGVSDSNHYVAANVPDFNANWLTQIPVELRNFLNNNASNFLLRQTLSSEPGNLDTFVLSTSGKPEDVIVYQSNTDTVVLDDIAGSGITSDTNAPIDAGFF